MDKNTEDPAKKRLQGEIEAALSSGILKKAVLSKSADKSIIRAVAEPFRSGEGVMLRLVEFRRDGKAVQRLISAEESPEVLSELAFSGFGEINLVAKDKVLTLMISGKGRTHFTGSLEGAERFSLTQSQDREKKYILTPERGGKFLRTLGVTDENDRVKDKKQAKYRQINKFLEQVELIYGKLPSDGVLTVCDLCCGKSYLTFAVYWYFTILRGRKVEMYGVDLKPDVIEFCSALRDRLGWDGMHFECGDVSRFVPPRQPDLVISLHACDTATDYVLAGAIHSGAKVILSTPCCQHELNSQIKCSQLSFLTEYSILKQKLSSAVTDALRAKFLEIHGYSVTVCELIDPEETPKNVLIRAIRRSNRERSGRSIPELVKEYDSACEFLGVDPKLREIFSE